MYRRLDFGLVQVGAKGGLDENEDQGRMKESNIGPTRDETTEKE